MSATLPADSPAPTARDATPSRGRRPSRWTAAACSVAVLAGVLRLWGLSRVIGDPFYDAAVRSMGQSWHNFFFGALEPGGSVAVDKTPVDLWLQVASTKLIGFSLFSLHLPEALAGSAATLALFFALRRTFGPVAALLSSIALAVLPVAALTARSDTMDSVLALLAIAALGCSLHALHTGRARWLILAAAAMGLAFNVKLTEALIPLPALGLLWLWASPRGARHRLAAVAATFVVVSLAWTVPAALTPRADRPFPLGSGNGSVWRVVFVYNGIDRLRGNGPTSYTSVGGGVPGPLRLLDTGASGYGAQLGFELLAGLLLGAIALAVGRRGARGPAGPEDVVRRRAAIALGVWLLTGVVLFSAMTRLQPRYLESVDPAVAAVLGIAAARLLALRTRAAAIGVAGAAVAIGGYAVALEHGLTPTATAAVAAAVAATIAAAASRRALLAASVAAALFTLPAVVSVRLVQASASDSYFRDPVPARVSLFLRAHRHDTRYEVASATVLGVVPIIARDGRPVLILRDLQGAITRLPRLQAAVANGSVRYLLTPRDCRHGYCPHTLRWALAHSARIGAGLYRFRPPAAPG